MAEQNADQNQAGTSSEPNGVGNGATGVLAKANIQNMAALSKAVSQFRTVLRGAKVQAENDVTAQQDDFLKKFGMGGRTSDEPAGGEGDQPKSFLVKIKTLVVNPSGRFYYWWTGVVTLAVLYNLTVIIARAVFNELQTGENFGYWAICDYLSDWVFVCDMMVKARMGYLEQGLLVRDSKLLALNYVKSKTFALDVAAILPTDLLQLLIRDHQ